MRLCLLGAFGSGGLLPVPRDSRLAMATIVEYNPSKQAVNAYPRWIISPLFPSPCCTSEMEPVGRQLEEDGWPFFYKRCRVCGYTVRRFHMSPDSFVERWKASAN